MNKEFFFENQMFKKDELGPIPIKQALEEIDQFRKLGTIQGHGVWYYAHEIADYLTTHFTDYTNSHPASNGYVWVVGFYFKLHNGRMSFCLIPTEYNPKTKLVKDRVTGDTLTSVRAVYPITEIKLAISPTEYPPTEGEAFDKGDMWP